ncbi:hypothetical protein BDW69DRAFT_189142 [Aspergillus filifer]
MPPVYPKDPLNPSVEEVRDEMSPQTDSPGPNAGLTWPQICTQHDSVLSSHLKMLQVLKEEVSGDSETSRVVASMIERTNKLILQFEGVKKHIVPRTHRRSESAKTGSNESNDREDRAAKKQKKRHRKSNDEVEQEVKPKNPVLEFERSKRKRMDVTLPGADQDVQNFIPVALQTEDISEEVNRRLKIKDEMRRKRDAKPEKRKRDRDSLASNVSTSSIGNTKPRKKARRDDLGDR